MPTATKFVSFSLLLSLGLLASVHLFLNLRLFLSSRLAVFLFAPVSEYSELRSCVKVEVDVLGSRP